MKSVVLEIEKPKVDNFAAWLDRIIEDEKLGSYRELAGRLGLHEVLISLYYTGKRSVSAKSIETMRESLGLGEESPEYFELLRVAQKNKLQMEKNQRGKLSRSN